MEHRGISELFLYWNRLRDDRVAPTRREIEPMDIRSFLADTFILENGMREDATFRLAGTRVCSVFGRELKNFTFYSIFNQADLSIVKRLVQSCFKDKSISVISFEGTSKSKRTLMFDCIILPLDGENESDRIFGAIFARDKPFWLGADIIVDCKVNTVRVLDPDKELLSLNSRPSVIVPPLRPSLNDLGQQSHENNHPAHLNGRRMGHLTVITGGLSKD
ncbi:MAG: PAS domain-containing protein [Rhizobiaceae bacterium]